MSAPNSKATPSNSQTWSSETSEERRHIQDVFDGCLDFETETRILALQAEAWQDGHQDGWSDRAHIGEDRSRNPFKEAPRG